ncbi:MAG: hypothetical protein GYB65_16195 [Chloroflexi bacterium]|nr:hypothetical protein [Chloroflexota bacterium]
MAQFRIMAKPVLGSMAPSLSRLGFVLFGLILGLLWAYQFAPIRFYDAEPVHLADGYKDQWIKAAAADLASGQEGAQAEAIRKLEDGGIEPEMIVELRDEAQQAGNAGLAGQLDNLLALAETEEVKSNAADQAATIERKPFRSFIFGPVGCILGTVIVGIVLALIGTFYWAVPVGKWAKKPAAVPAGSGGMPLSGATHADRVAAKRAVADQKTDFSAVGETPPVSQHMSTYIQGDDLYDDSFSIETDAGEFLGECGAAISETIGVGDPKKVTAIEVWLFDKNDIRTVTKVMMSEHAFNDQALRTKLAPKGEAVRVEPGGVTTLETQSLRLQARLIDLEYGEGSLPSNSFFQRFSVELAAWPKDDGGAGGDRPNPPEAAAFGDTAELLNL